MKLLVTPFLAFFVAAFVQASIPTPSIDLPSGVAGVTSGAVTPSSSSQISKCVLNCAAKSLASSGSNCTSFQDPCICADTKFQDAMSKCLKDCTTAEQLAAKAFEKGVCTFVSNSTSSSATGSGTANSTSSPSQSGSGALAVQIEFVRSSLFALTVVVGGAVMGGLLI